MDKRENVHEQYVKRVEAGEEPRIFAREIDGYSKHEAAYINYRGGVGWAHSTARRLLRRADAIADRQTRMLESAVRETKAALDELDKLKVRLEEKEVALGATRAKLRESGKAVEVRDRQVHKLEKELLKAKGEKKGAEHAKKNPSKKARTEAHAD